MRAQLTSALVFVVFSCFSLLTAQETEQSLNQNSTANATNEDLLLNSTTIPGDDNSTSLDDYTTEPEVNQTQLIGTLNATLAGETNDTEEAAALHLARSQPAHPPPGEEQSLEGGQAADEEPEAAPAAPEHPEQESQPTEDRREEDREEDEEARRQAEAEAQRVHEEAQRRYQETQLQEHDRRQEAGGEHDPRTASTSEGLPPKQSIQATFKFTTEKRCLDFLPRLKAKGRNEHSDHPLTCPAAFDGILCWRPADPGETLLQVCPDVPRQRMSFARRECVNGQWREYPHANRKLQLQDILHSNYEDCYQVPVFLRKHGSEAYRDGQTSAELQGPRPEVREYDLRPTPESSTSLVGYVPAPDAAASQQPVTDSNVVADEPPLPPWILTRDKECQDFLIRYRFDNTREGTWCSGLSDGHFCWPATAPNTTASQPCRHEAKPSAAPHATRICNADGRWNTVKSDGSQEPAGWTNREECDGPAGAAGEQAVVAGAAVGGALLLSAAAAPNASNPAPDEAATGSPMTGALTSNLEPARHAPNQPWLQSTKESCEQFLRDIAQLEETDPGITSGSCRGDSDGNICWPTTSRDKTVSQPCPPIAGLDSSRSVTRTCGKDGVWSKGNYTDCFASEIKELMAKCASSATLLAAQKMMPSILASLLFFLL